MNPSLTQKLSPEIFSQSDMTQRGPVIIRKLPEAQLRSKSDTWCACPSEVKQGC